VCLPPRLCILRALYVGNPLLVGARRGVASFPCPTRVPLLPLVSSVSCADAVMRGTGGGR
jgi:hypothetical protein